MSDIDPTLAARLKDAQNKKPAPTLSTEEAKKAGLTALPSTPPVQQAAPTLSTEDSKRIGLTALPATLPNPFTPGPTPIDQLRLTPPEGPDIVTMNAGLDAKYPPDPATAPAPIETRPMPTVTAPAVASSVDAVSAASPGPTVKDMIATLIKKPENYQEAHTQAVVGQTLAKAAADNPSFGDMLKKLGGGILSVVNAFGLGYGGHPELAQYRVQQQQEFEKAQAQMANEARLKELQAQAEVQARMQAIEQKYAIDKMNIQNQMNVANLPIEKKAELQNQLAVVEAQHQAAIDEQARTNAFYFEKLGANPKANGGTFWTGG
jgi:hypothetical protein